jgi:hypothetical protein
VSIVRIGAKELRRRNFARTGEKSDPIDVKYLVTVESFDRTVVICVATGAISGMIVVTRDTRNRGPGKKGKRQIPLSLSQLPLFVCDALELDEWRH